MNTDDLALDTSFQWAHEYGDRYHLNQWYENEARNFHETTTNVSRYANELSRVVHWRCKSRVIYPLKHRTTVAASFIKNKCWVPIRRVFRKRPVDEDIELEDMRTYPGATEFGYLTRDIWTNVLVHVNESERFRMLQLNRAWLETIAPSAYKRIHCLVVIAGTEKLKKNDHCYLSAGPDSAYESTARSYDIYLRSRASRKQDYEILDTESHGKKSNGLQLVTKHQSTVLLINYIMNNPKSKMKQYVQEFSIDVIFLDGLDWGKLRNDHLDQTIDELVSKDRYTTSSYTNRGQITASRYCGEYEWSNRVRRRALGMYDDKFFYHMGDNHGGKVYPNDVYKQELEIVQRSLENIENGRRRMIFNGDLEQTFESGCFLNQRSEENLYNTDPQRVLSPYFTSKLQNSTEDLSIVNRNFCNEGQVSEFIENILDIYTVRNKSNSIGVCSALFSGMESNGVGYYDPQTLLYAPGQIVLNRVLD